MRRALLFLVATCLLAMRADANESGWASQRGLFVMTYRTDLQPLQINVLHSWVLHLEDADGNAVTGALVEVDGGMPAHDHGLPTRPRVTEELGGGDYRLDGLRFHMRGDWVITLTIEADGVIDTVTVILTL